MKIVLNKVQTKENDVARFVIDTKYIVGLVETTTDVVKVTTTNKHEQTMTFEVLDSFEFIANAMEATEEVWDELEE